MYGITTHHMARIDSYEKAKKYFDGEKPWRNRSDHIRPLGLRREQNKRIERRGDHYVLMLYNTALVTYSPTGVYVRLYHTMSSRRFLWKVLPAGMNAVAHRGNTFIQVGNKTYTSSGKPLAFAFDKARNTWTLLNPDDCQRFENPVFDRKLGAQAHKKIEPFVQWYTAVQRLAPARQVPAWRGNEAAAATQLVLGNAPLETYPKLAEWVSDIATLRTKAYEVIGAHGSVPVELGELPHRKATAL